MKYGPVLLGLIIFLAGFWTAKYFYGSSSSTNEVTDKKKTHIIRITDPNGNVHEVIDVDESTKTKTLVAMRPKNNISILVKTDGLDTGRYIPRYGISFSREVLGPVTVGLFGYTDSTIGVSVGLNF